MSSAFLEILRQHKIGLPAGIFSICSAHPVVLEAVARLSAQYARPLLVESTCNQVNQQGGYMGMIPGQFVSYLLKITSRRKLPAGGLILGGDHLGPYPWRHFPAGRAMLEARQLVRDYVLAGYTKIHLDASTHCADDDPHQPLAGEVAARRTADLCQAAESASSELPVSHQPLCYVIGTEVPIPGGAQAFQNGLQVTRVEALHETIESTKLAFFQRGLQAAWERVVAVVVQPGVEFGDQVIHPYQSAQAVELTRYIEKSDQLVYEAHSTDYQTSHALKQMVEDHFAILKVGPGLTFAFREAVFALSCMESEWLNGKAGVQLSELPEVLERVMMSGPAYWESYYQGDAVALRAARKFSYSDRSRYYWTHPLLQQALSRLFNNLERYPVPMTLLSQFMPVQYVRVRAGTLEANPHEWVYDHICDALHPYLYACGWI